MQWGPKGREQKDKKYQSKKIKIDQLELHRPQKKNEFSTRGGGGEISEEIFNDQPSMQESGCKHTINQSTGQIKVDDSKDER